MTLKPPTRTLPKVVMKEWPTLEQLVETVTQANSHPEIDWGAPVGNEFPNCEPLSDFTRVVEETGILDQERSQKEKSR